MPIRNGETKAVCLLIVSWFSKAGFGRCCPRKIEQTARIFWDGEVCELVDVHREDTQTPAGSPQRLWGLGDIQHPNGQGPEKPRSEVKASWWGLMRDVKPYPSWWGLSNASERTKHNKGHSTENQDSMPYNRQQQGKTKLKSHSPYFCRSRKNYKGHSSPRANENIRWSMTSFWIWAIPSGVEDWCSYFFLRQKCCPRFWLLIYKKNSSTLMDEREVP